METYQYVNLQEFVNSELGVSGLPNTAKNVWKIVDTLVKKGLDPEVLENSSFTEHVKDGVSSFSIDDNKMIQEISKPFSVEFLNVDDDLRTVSWNSLKELIATIDSLDEDVAIYAPCSDYPIKNISGINLGQTFDTFGDLYNWYNKKFEQGKKIILSEDEMETELIKRGYKIEDDEGCIDSMEVCSIACDWYGFQTKVNCNDALEFIGNF